jgi:hypothetical protein
MPLSINPVTFSLKVAVTKNGAFIVVGEVDVKATVGAVKSAVRPVELPPYCYYPQYQWL